MKIPSDPSPRWRLPDLVDLEVALESDAGLSRDRVEERDRAWAREVAATGGIPTTRGGRIFRWLREVPFSDPDRARPGETVERAFAILIRLAIGLGLILGATTAASVLRYEGDAPVNVTGFFFVLILLQIALVGVSIFGLVRWNRMGSGWLGGFLKSGLDAVASRLGRGQPGEPGNVSGSEVSAAGVFFRVHRKLAGYRITRIGQIFGVAFNLGAVGAIFLVLLVADRAFGWQSTLIQSPEVFHRLVEAIALPWRDWIPTAAPSLSAVEGSRIILKDGAAALETPDLTAWWPFLVMAVLVYGLLPRLLLWGLLAGLEWRALRRLNLAELRYEDLDDRLLAGWRQGERDSPGPDSEWLETESGTGSVPSPEQAPVPARERGGYLLIDEGELIGFPRELLQEAIETACGGAVGDTLRFDQVDGLDAPPKRVALPIESWTAPVEEDLERVRSLREKLGPDAILRVLLLPVPGEVAPQGRWVEIWSRYLSREGDPNLSVRALVIEPEVAS